MQIVAFGKWRIDSFMRWQSKKDSLKFLQIVPTIKKKNLQVAKSSWSITQRQSPNGRVHCRVLKRTRWWGEGVFGYGTSNSHIFWEEGKRGAELQMLRLVLQPWGIICVCPNSYWVLTERDYAKVASLLSLCRLLYLRSRWTCHCGIF